jgi:hypothetical protein
MRASSKTITFAGHPVREAIHEFTELSVAWLVRPGFAPRPG